MAFNKDTKTLLIDNASLNVSVEPWFCLGFTLKTLRMDESVGGDLAIGTVLLEGYQKNLTDQWLNLSNNLIIKLQDTKNNQYYEIYGYIVEKQLLGGFVQLDFNVYPLVGREFDTVPRISKLTSGADGLLGILKKLYQYPDNFNTQEILNRNINCKSDINQCPDIYQIGETDHSLMTKLLYSYRQQCVFGFGLEGMFVKEIKTPALEERKEPNIICLDGEVNQVTPIFINYEPQLYQVVQDFKNNSQHLGCSIVGQDNYTMFNKSFEKLKKNYLFNKNYLKTRLYSSCDVVYYGGLPRFRIGETILYANPKEPESERLLYLVTSNSYYISNCDESDEFGQKVSVVSTIRGIQDLDWDSYYSDNKYPKLEKTQQIKI